MALKTRSCSISGSASLSISGSIWTPLQCWSPVMVILITPPPTLAVTVSTASCSWATASCSCIFLIWLIIPPPAIPPPPIGRLNPFAIIHSCSNKVFLRFFVIVDILHVHHLPAHFTKGSADHAIVLQFDLLIFVGCLYI